MESAYGITLSLLFSFSLLTEPNSRAVVGGIRVTRVTRPVQRVYLISLIFVGPFRANILQSRQIWHSCCGDKRWACLAMAFVLEPLCRSNVGCNVEFYQSLHCRWLIYLSKCCQFQSRGFF